MKILTASQMAEVDRLTSERFFIPSILLMENAGRCFTEELRKACPELAKKRILILCGRGNNGGDGFVIARYLSLSGAKPEVFLFADPEKLSGDAGTNFKIVQAMGIPVHILPADGDIESFLRPIEIPDVIVDALFGTGLSKPIGPDFRPVVEWIRKASMHAYVASVDIPSGLLADSPGIPGPAVKANLTVTFSALKLAHVLSPAADYAGKIVLASIGSPEALFENSEYQLNLVDAKQVRDTLPRRARDSHKGSYGHVYIAAGSYGKSGAALMTGMAALRSGSGLVTLWLPRNLQGSIVGKYPELMTEFLPETADGTLDHSGAKLLLAQLPQSDALVLGPGLTTHPSTQKLIHELVRRSPVPVVLDADGINAFVPPDFSLRNEFGQPVIITPHPGEMARLMGKKIAEIQQNRLEAARACAAQHGCHVILKGYQTVIAAPTGEVFINNTGNPGMATGGTGDILAGMTGRFAAEWKLQNANGNHSNLARYLAAAVYLHGVSGDLAAADGSMESLVATDLLIALPNAFKTVISS